MPAHGKTTSHQRIEILADLFLRDGEAVQIPFDAHEENLSFRIDMLVEIENVAAVLEDELGD